MRPSGRRVVRGTAASLCLLLASTLAPTLATSVDLSPQKPELVVPRLSRMPTIEDFLNMSAPVELQGSLARVSGFVQRDPEDGRESTQRTEVYTGYDDASLYVVFLAFDDSPEKIRAHMTRRENIFGDERVQVQLDTFNDQRRAYSFMTNPHGIQWDAIWTEGQGYDASWDTLWHSKGRLTEQGYVVLMEIPFKSLRFAPTDEQTWRVVFQRNIPRNSESAFWPPVTNRVSGRLNQASTMRGLSGISAGRNIDVIPYATASSSRLMRDDGEFDVEDGTADMGVDAKFVIKDSLALDLTVNPDFSQVESDQPQVTVNQRFEVFFPEKRPFFLENANYFRTPINLLFTRRIADPDFGARMTGKLGNWSVGALLADDQAPGKSAEPGSFEAGEAARYGVLRVSRDLPNQSWLGLIYTHRDFLDTSNDVAGIDGRFKFGENWSTDFQAAYSSTRTEDGELLTDPTVRVRIGRGGRKLNYNFNYRDIGRDFRTEAGFVRRSDLREATQWVRYRFWPEGRVLVNWGPQLWMRYAEDQTGLRLDTNVNPSLRFEFRKASGVTLWHWEEQSRLRPEDFDTLTAPADYDTSGNSINLWSDYFSWMGLRAELWASKSINFVPPEGQPPAPSESSGGSLSLTFRPVRNLVNDNRFIWTGLSPQDGGGTAFRNRIVRSQWNWQFNVKWSLRTIFQYDETLADPEYTSLETTKNFNADFLLTYLVNPGTAAYIGYNSNHANLDLLTAAPGQRHSPTVVRTEDDFLNNSRGLFVKVSYLFRL